MNCATKEQLIAFEDRIKDLWEKGELPYLLHLSGGNEDKLIAIFHQVKEGDWIFSTHRSHYHYLLAGGDPERLEKLIRDGNSMFVFSRAINFVSSSILAGCCGIAAGVAWTLQQQNSPNRVWCFLGDGAEDEGHFYEAVQFVRGHDLPCTFIVEDNNRSVDATNAQRRGKYYSNLQASCIKRYSYVPRYPHAGSGCKHHIEFKPITKP